MWPRSLQRSLAEKSKREEKKVNGSKLQKKVMGLSFSSIASVYSPMMERPTNGQCDSNLVSEIT